MPVLSGIISMMKRLLLLAPALVFIAGSNPAYASCLGDPTLDHEDDTYMYFNVVNNCGGTATISYSRTAANGKVETGSFGVGACKSLDNYMLFKGKYSFTSSISGGADMYCQGTSVKRDDKNLQSKPEKPAPAPIENQAAAPPLSDLKKRIEEAKKKTENADTFNQRQRAEVHRLDREQNDRAAEAARTRADLDKCESSKEHTVSQCSRLIYAYIRNHCIAVAVANRAICVAEALHENESDADLGRNMLAKADAQYKLDEAQFNRDEQARRQRAQQEQQDNEDFQATINGIVNGIVDSQSGSTYYPPAPRIVPAPSYTSPSVSPGAAQTDRGHFSR